MNYIQINFDKSYFKIVEYENEEKLKESLIMLHEELAKNSKFIYISGFLMNTNKIATIHVCIDSCIKKYNIITDEIGISDIEFLES
jgi:hypothetical protein